VSIVSSGHQGAVTAMDYDDGHGLLFSGGEDGTVRIWGASDGSLRAVLAVSRHGMTRIAANPSRPLVAVMEATESFAVRLSVWDWSSGTAVYAETLEEEPLFLRWSSTGNVLLFGLPAWDSLRMLRVDGWSRIASALESDGIVGFAALSRGENTAMSYSPVGRISYRSIGDGSVLQEAKTVAYLSALRLTADLQYMIGATDRELVVIDALSGDLHARMELPEVRDLDVSAEGDRILCITSSGRSALSLWARTDSGLFRSFLPDPLDAMEVRAACFGGETLYAAGPDGAIWSVSREGVSRRFTGDDCPVLTGIDTRENRLAVASEERIYILESDFLAADPDRLPSFIRLRSFDNPFLAPADLMFLDDGRVLLWRKGAESGAMAILDPDSGSLESGPLFSGELVCVKRSGRRLLTVEKGGRIRLTDLDWGVASFQAQESGMNAAIPVSADQFVGGRSSHAQGALVRINVQTGETVDIPDGNRFVFSLAAFSDQVFTMGVDQEGGTVLGVRRGGQLEEGKLIDRFPMEDLGATMSLGPGGRLFYMLGSERIRVWDGQKTTELTGSGRIPRILNAASGFLIALNTDSTISLWDGPGCDFLCNISLFRDDQWAIPLGGGGFLSSRDEEPRVKTVMDGVPLSDNRLYRIPLSGGNGKSGAMHPTW